MKKNIKNHLLYLMTFIITILLWSLFSYKENNPIVFPMPNIIFDSLLKLLLSKDTYTIILSTLSRLIVSLAIAGSLGLFFGLISGINKTIEALIRPIVTTLRTLPIVSIIVIIIIWLGYDKAPYVITFMMIFPVVYQAILEGVRNIPRENIEVLKLETNKVTLEIVKLVYIPCILPFIRTAFTQSIGLGIKVLVMSEFIAQTRNSIGYMIYLEKQNLNLDLVYSWTIILIIVVLIIEFIVIQLNNIDI